MARITYEEWMDQVDREIDALVPGLTHMDLGDHAYADSYEARNRPATVARRVLKENGYNASARKAAPKVSDTGTAPKARAKKAKAEKAKAEEFIEDAKAAVSAGGEAKAKVKKKRATKWEHITAEDIVKARDTDGLSWKDVAIKLDLGSPGVARRAYTELTGKDHTTSQMTGRRSPKGTGSKKRKAIVRPEWTNETPVDEIAEAIAGRMIVVKRQYGEEEIHVGKVTEFTKKETADGETPLTVHFHAKDNGAARAVAVEAILDVR